MQPTSRYEPSPRRRSVCTLLACTILLLQLHSARGDAHGGPVRLTLGGGLLHTSGFIAPARVGGQEFRLQVDISQGALTLPAVGCSTCRLGDRRYDVSKSNSRGRAVPCGNALCGAKVCMKSVAGECPICTGDGRCCVDMAAEDVNAASKGLGGAKGKDLKCVYNLKFTDNMDANGTMYKDTVELGFASVPKVVFGGMREETRDFEMAYVDGILGLGFDLKGHPSSPGAFMDFFVNSTGLDNMFSMCVTAYGGSLTLGAADKDLATEDYKYVPLDTSVASNHFLVGVEKYGLVGDTRVEMPELVTGVWSTATTGIAIGKTSFLAILEVLMENYCHIPGLCGVNSWFRSGSCIALSDKSLAAMPPLTFYLAGKVPIVMEATDYLIAYKEVDGHQIRCVGFIVVELLASRGVGVLFGTSVMQRHAVTFDRKGKRVGIAKANVDKCGPKTGSSAGLMESSLSGLRNMSDIPILTASSPGTNMSGVAGSSELPALLVEEECRAEDGCSACARNDKCAFSYANGRCVSTANAGTRPFPYCSGLTCACPVVGMAGWYAGIAVGVLLACLCSGGGLCVYTKRKRKQRYQSVVPYEAAEHEVETF